MTHILLVGAGFSANWGGPPANEVFDWLLQRPEISGDARLRQMLWDHRNAGGFENTLSQVQADYLHSPNDENKGRLDRFQKAIDEIFSDMDRGFVSLGTWEFHNEIGRRLLDFLVKFDAIFILNQDLLFERYYLFPRENVLAASNQRWNAALLRGMKAQPSGGSTPFDPGKTIWRPDPAEFTIPDRCQPVFKLHGSYRWEDGTGNRLMVIGGSKGLMIASQQVLKWSFAQFQRYLGLGGTRLMVIGYGFRDPHINQAIQDAAPKGLRMFIVDPLGVDVCDPTRELQIRMPNPFQDIIESASKHTLRDTFGANPVEHARIMKFFK